MVKQCSSVAEAGATALCSCRVAALDLRGHGHTSCQPEDDLSAETLVADVVAVWQAAFGPEAAPTVLLGHSMGGAIAVRAAASKVLSAISQMICAEREAARCCVLHAVLRLPAGRLEQSLSDT